MPGPRATFSYNGCWIGSRAGRMTSRQYRLLRRFCSGTRLGVCCACCIRRACFLVALQAGCIAKGKAGTRYEFGVKTSVAVTHARTTGGQFIFGMQALPGNPYDGHTLSGQFEQVERLTGIAMAGAD